MTETLTPTVPADIVRRAWTAHRSIASTLSRARKMIEQFEAQHALRIEDARAGVERIVAKARRDFDIAMRGAVEQLCHQAPADDDLLAMAAAVEQGNRLVAWLADHKQLLSSLDASEVERRVEIARGHVATLEGAAREALAAARTAEGLVGEARLHSFVDDRRTLDEHDHASIAHLGHLLGVSSVNRAEVTAAFAAALEAAEQAAADAEQAHEGTDGVLEQVRAALAGEDGSKPSKPARARAANPSKEK
jgi:hypothetical protein